MESSRAGKRLWRLVRVVFYMLRKGLISKDKLMMDLHLLLQRGKLAGKALGNFMTFHHHHDRGGGGVASFSCRSMDPDLSFYHPKEIEFSCSNSPAFPFRAAIKQKHRRRLRPRHDDDLFDFDAAAVAEAFEMLNSVPASEDAESVLASPSPAPMVWSYGMSPAVVPRQLRVTDSPYPASEEEVHDGRIDEQAEEFIRRFYEQLRLQKRIPVTPECRLYRQHETVMGRA